MNMRRKVETVRWLLTKRPGWFRRLKLYLRFRRENNRWSRTCDWSTRVSEAVSSPDNAFIPRVANAGQVQDGRLIMHNGLMVHELGYYGEGLRDLVKANRGVHEPQEERLFMEVLKCLPPRSAMLEFGSYWAFYSMWFYREIEQGVCYCVEPDSRNIRMGQENFAFNFGPNAPRVFFENAFAGECEAAAGPERQVPTVTTDGILSRHSVSRLALLHADTQGHELEVLVGASKALASHAIDFVFLSTHSHELHRLCLDTLTNFGYSIVADVDLLETYSFDGLIVGRSPRAPSCDVSSVSLKGY